MHLFLGNFVSDHYTIEMMKKHLLKYFHVENDHSKLRQIDKLSFQKYFDNPKKLHQIKNDYIFRIVYHDMNSKTSKINSFQKYFLINSLVIFKHKKEGFESKEKPDNEQESKDGFD
jgi:hypothetical protein